MDLTQNELDQLRTAMNAELDRLIAARKPEVKQWPQVGDMVYTCTSLGDVVVYRFGGSMALPAPAIAMALPAIDRYLEIGNAFKTEAEAERRVEALKVQAELRRMPGVKIGSDCGVGIGVNDSGFFYCCGTFTKSYMRCSIAGVLFESITDVNMAIQKIGQERLQIWLDDYLQTPIGGE